MEEKFYDLSEDTIESFRTVYEEKAFPINISFQYVGNAKQKCLIKIKKLSDEYQHAFGKDMMVTINEDFMDAFDDESIKILFEQAMDVYYVDGKSGKIKKNQPDLVTSSGLLNKYGIDKISKANQVDSLYNQQKEDSQVEAGMAH